VRLSEAGDRLRPEARLRFSDTAVIGTDDLPQILGIERGG